jgi:hypothetical protein
MPPETAVSLIRKLYLLQFLLVSAVVPWAALDSSRSWRAFDVWQVFVALAAPGFAYVGLRRRKDWVVPLVLFMAVYDLTFILLVRAETFGAVIFDVFRGALAAYLIVLFTRPTTKSLFGYRSEAVF